MPGGRRQNPVADRYSWNAGPIASSVVPVSPSPSHELPVWNSNHVLSPAVQVVAFELCLLSLTHFCVFLCVFTARQQSLVYAEHCTSYSDSVSQSVSQSVCLSSVYLSVRHWYCACQMTRATIMRSLLEGSVMIS